MRTHITFLVNGKKQSVGAEEVCLTIGEFLRRKLLLTGTKIVCAEGDCGACSVLVGKGGDGDIEYLPINSCIVPLYLIDGCHLITVEGLQKKRQMNAVQESMLKNHGAQCGYCTPGFVVALTGMMEDKQPKSREEIRQGLCGNLCRCTGYEPIIKAGLEASEKKSWSMSEIYDSAEINSALQSSNTPFNIKTDAVEIYAPDKLTDALAFKAANPNAKIVQGATDLGVMINKRDLQMQKVLILKKIPKMNHLEINNNKAIIGASATLKEFETHIAAKIPEIFEMMKQFASPQIKNVGSLAGNVLNASPIADSIPFLMVLNAQLHLQSKTRGNRSVNINSFYLGYKKLDLKEDELLTHIEFEIPKEQDLRLYRNSRRTHLDIASVTAAFLVKMKKSSEIESINIAYGGVGPVVCRLPKTESYLANKHLDEKTLTEAAKIIESEISPISDVRASQEYRHLLAKNFLKKLSADLTTGDF